MCPGRHRAHPGRAAEPSTPGGAAFAHPGPAIGWRGMIRRTTCPLPAATRHLAAAAVAQDVMRRLAAASAHGRLRRRRRRRRRSPWQLRLLTAAACQRLGCLPTPTGPRRRRPMWTEVPRNKIGSVRRTDINEKPAVNTCVRVRNHDYGGKGPFETHWTLARADAAAAAAADAPPSSPSCAVRSIAPSGTVPASNGDVRSTGDVAASSSVRSIAAATAVAAAAAAPGADVAPPPIVAPAEPSRLQGSEVLGAWRRGGRGTSSSES